MGEDSSSRPFATPGNWGPHGFHLPMLQVQLFKRAATNQERSIPGGPERNFRLTQSFKIKGMNAFARRQFMHVLQMLVQQRMYSRARKVVDFDLHRSNPR